MLTACTLHDTLYVYSACNGGVKLARNKYPEETVQKILEASLKLFLEKGYEETTVLDIIKNMGGMTRGAFYHHFKSKEEVFDALSDKLFNESNPFEEAKRQKELNGLEKFRYALTKANLDDTDHHKLSVSVMQLLSSPAFLKKLIIETNRDVLAPICQEIIEEGMKDGSIKVSNPKLVAELFVYLTNFWTIPTIFPTTEEEAWEKVLFLKEIFDNIGFPILDDEYLAQLKEDSAISE